MNLFFNTIFTHRYNIFFNINIETNRDEELKKVVFVISNLNKKIEEYYIGFSDKIIDLKELNDKVKRNTRHKAKKFRDLNLFKSIRPIDKLKYSYDITNKTHQIFICCNAFDERNDFGRYSYLLFTRPKSRERTFYVAMFDNKEPKMGEKTFIDTSLIGVKETFYKKHVEKPYVKTRRYDLFMRRTTDIRYESRYTYVYDSNPEPSFSDYDTGRIITKKNRNNPKNKGVFIDGGLVNFPVSF